MNSNTVELGNQYIWTDTDGTVDEETPFIFGEYTSAYHSCSLVFKDIMYVFGGETVSQQAKRQISVVRTGDPGYSLQRLGSLQFDFSQGSCTVAADHVVLCFPFEKDETVATICHRTSDLTTWEDMHRSHVDHAKTRISSSPDHIFVTGGKRQPIGHGLTELMNLETWSWNETTPFPFGQKPYLTHSAPTLFIRGHFYVFGGVYADEPEAEFSSASIVQFNPRTHKWFHGGNLDIPRKGHSVIETGNEFLIIGGKGGDMESERCRLVDEVSNMMKCVKLPSLIIDNFVYWPEVFAISEDL